MKSSIRSGRLTRKMHWGGTDEGKSGSKDECLAHIKGGLDRYAPAEPTQEDGQKWLKMK